MARYRKIDPRIWNDAKFMSSSDDAKLIFFMILTHPHLTMLGAMRATIGGLADELCWLRERFAKGFGELVSEGLLKASGNNQNTSPNLPQAATNLPQAATNIHFVNFVWAPNFMKHNPIENPNQLIAAIGCLDLLPECDLKVEITEQLKQVSERFAKPLPEPLPEQTDNGMPNQEQRTVTVREREYAHVIPLQLAPSKKAKGKNPRKASPLGAGATTGDKAQDRYLLCVATLMVSNWATKSVGGDMPHASKSATYAHLVGLVAKGHNADQLRGRAAAYLQECAPDGSDKAKCGTKSPQWFFGATGPWQDFDDAPVFPPIPLEKIQKTLNEAS